MYTKLSELVRISEFLQNWNGYQSSKIKTVNSKLQKYHERNEDSFLNVTVLKILEEYDNSAYLKALVTGVSFTYQQSNYKMKSENDYVNCQVFGKNGELSYTVKITNNSIIFDKKPSNADSYSLIMSLFIQNNNDTYRSSNI